MKKMLFGLLLTLLVASVGWAQPTSIDRVSFNVFLSTSNEVPPVTGVDAGGTATVSILLTHEVVASEDCIDEDDDGIDDDSETICECVDGNGDGFDDDTGNSCSADGLVDPDTVGDVVSAQVDFLVNYAFGADEVLTGMHIHRGVRGESGPVVINSGLTGPVPVAAGSGSFFRSVPVTDMAGIEIVEEVLANPANFYLNVHTQSRPSGIMRGQLRDLPAGPGGGDDGTGGDPPTSATLSQIVAILNQMRIENAAHRATTDKIAERLNVVPVDPDTIDPDSLPEVEDICPDDDTDGLDDDTGDPCPAEEEG